MKEYRLTLSMISLLLLPVTTTAQSNNKQIVKGRALYNAKCFSCHGKEAQGNQQYPKLTGYKRKKIISILSSYKTGRAKVNANEIMSYTLKMTSLKEIHAISYYIASLNTTSANSKKNQSTKPKQKNQ